MPACGCREGIFEILPQTVMEFQNLWTDRMTVLDLMSVPGLSYLTWVSEYDQCYWIMMTTIITASLDLTTPYSADSALVGMTLYISVVLQLAARLFVFGSVLSIQQHGERNNTTTLLIIAFFVGTYCITLLLFRIFSARNMYHEGDIRYRAGKAKTQYKVTLTTGLGLNAGVSGVVVSVRLHGKLKGAKKLSEWYSDFTEKESFQAGESSELQVSCPDLGSITQVDLMMRKKGSCGGEENSVEFGGSPAERWLCASVEVCNMGPHTTWIFDADQWVGYDADAVELVGGEEGSADVSSRATT